MSSRDEAKKRAREARASAAAAPLEPGSLIRLTTLEVRPERRRPAGRRRRREGWMVFARDQASCDPNRGFVDIASQIPPIEAIEGTEVRLTVRWVAPPPVDLVRWVAPPPVDLDP